MELIKIEYKNGMECVNARGLYASLGRSKDFSGWVRVLEGRFEYGKDFIVVSDVSSRHKRETRDYFFSVYAAIAISMSNGTTCGFKTYQYLREYHSGRVSLPKDTNNQNQEEKKTIPENKMSAKELQCEILTLYSDFMNNCDADILDFKDLRGLQISLATLSVNLNHFICYHEDLGSMGFKIGEDTEDIVDEFKEKKGLTHDVDYKDIGHVYVISYDGMTKIGISKVPKSRISTLQTSNPIGFQQYYVSEKIEKYKEIEKTLHDRFKDERLKGEWFNISFEEAVSELHRHTI